MKHPPWWENPPETMRFYSMYLIDVQLLSLGDRSVKRFSTWPLEVADDRQAHTHTGTYVSHHMHTGIDVQTDVRPCKTHTHLIAVLSCLYISVGVREAELGVA